MNGLVSFKSLSHSIVLFFIVACTDSVSVDDDKDKNQHYQEKREMSAVLPALISAYQLHYPEIYSSLNPPSTETTLSDLEAITGYEVPADFKAMYLAFNGQKSLEHPMFENGYSLLDVELLISNWNLMKQLYDNQPEFRQVNDDSGKIIDTWWLPRWLPFAELGNGDLICIDLQPGKLGTSGQVIEFVHDGTERKFLASGIKEYLGELESDLKSNKLSLDKNAILMRNKNHE